MMIARPRFKSVFSGHWRLVGRDPYAFGIPRAMIKMMGRMEANMVFASCPPPRFWLLAGLYAKGRPRCSLRSLAPPRFKRLFSRWSYPRFTEFAGLTSLGAFPP